MKAYVRSAQFITGIRAHSWTPNGRRNYCDVSTAEMRNSDWSLFTKVFQDIIDLLVKGTAHTRMKVIGRKTTVKTSATSDVSR